MTLRDFLERYCDYDCEIDVSIANSWEEIEGRDSNYVGINGDLSDPKLLDMIVRKVDASSVGELTILVSDERDKDGEV